ncbi:MAG: hypothetical protein KA444_00535 [Bacteroidia bacterium]|nr:hypothetical protein [Bacteroidia bacterium]
MKKDISNSQAPDQVESWAQAEKLLDNHFQQKRRKKRVLIFFFAATGLVMSTFLFSKLMQNSPGGVIEHNISIQNATINEDQLNQVSGSTEKVTTNKVASSPVKESQSNITNSQSQPTSSESQYSNQIKSSTQNQLVSKKKENDANQRNTNLSETSKSNFSNIETEEKAGAQGISTTINTNVNENFTSTEPPLDEAIKTIELQTKIVLLEPLANNELSIKSSEQLLHIKGDSVSIAKPRSGAQLSKQIAIYSSLSSISKSLDAAEMSEYLQRRRTEENSILAPSIGAAFQMSLNNISASLGVEYSYWGEETKYEAYSNQTQYTTTSSWQTYHRTVIDTDTAYISGLEWLLQTQVHRLDSSYSSYTDTAIVSVYDPTVAERNGVNKFSYVEIPLIVSYHIPFNRFGIGMSIGLSPAWLTSQKGYYLKEDLSGVESISETKPLKTFFLNGRLSLDLSYRLNPRLNLILSPQIKTNLASISNSKNAVEQRYTATGINLGVFYSIH